MSRKISLKTFALCIGTIASLSVALPAHADTIQDIQTCKSTLQNQMDLNDYRVEFVRKDGVTTSKARTVFLKMVGMNGRQTFQVSCQLDKNYVVALRTTEAVLYASR